MSLKEDFEYMAPILDVEAPSYTTVNRWTTQFKIRREAWKMIPIRNIQWQWQHRMWSTMFTTSSSLIAGHNLNRPKIIFEPEISQEQVYNIIHQEFGINKVSARLVSSPHIGSQTSKVSHFEGQPGALRTRSWRFLAAVRCNRGILGPQLATKEQPKQLKRLRSPILWKAEIARSSRKDGSQHRKDHNIHFLGRESCAAGGLLGDWLDHHCCLLRLIAAN